ncbi:methyltransferase domain-containing protein [Nocardia sp. 2]|uniref:Methyltransferase domain-containing protein n=1 Tax=Nocardia acididurans TaxID=2802282 RepID=A0ABS1M913_9NOCA|nr:methyltransferase domain-containing protein [Nocardia acididurans]MBL1077135.1 methyltransferase domain-containing protein [Nocardia acididurans]
MTDDMLVTSRSAAEYHAMFDLSPADVAGSVLDCCSGGSSFAAETGTRVTAVDPMYRLGHEELAQRVRTALRDGDSMIAAHAHRFEWGFYGGIEQRRQMRYAAGEQFIADRAAHPDRYVAAALPELPFPDGSFDLVLCSHLLFTWSDRFDEDFHRRALAELVRVARREVRIYPLVVQATGEPVEFLDRLCDELRAAGHEVELHPVPYRFQQGAHYALWIRSGGDCDSRPQV